MIKSSLKKFKGHKIGTHNNNPNQPYQKKAFITRVGGVS
jgi:hypothetical protein